MAQKKTTTTAGPWGPQQPYLKFGLEAAKNQLMQGMPDYYPGQTMVDVDPATQAGWDATTGYATSPQAQAQQAAAMQSLMGTYGTAGAAQKYGTGLLGNLGQDQFAGLTPFSGGQYGDLLAGKVDTAHLQPTIDAMGHDIRKSFEPQMAALRDQGTAYQRGGGSRGALQNERVMNELSGQLTRAAAPMYSQAYQQAQAMRMPAAQMGIGAQQYGQGLGMQGGQLAQGSMGLANQVQGMPLQMYGALGQVGKEKMGYGQEQINRDMQKYNYDMMKNRQSLQDYMRNVTGQYGGTSTTLAPGASGLSKLGKVASIVAPWIPSDVRIKENIEPIGNYDGLGVYSYNYIGSDVPQVGVMAQEVEKKIPEAVMEIGGIKHVNYGAI
tara:strand:- start:4727 stop:5869 length:1143 start_codon:yes stop_codon:yes gene_type:complete